ncbi:hypothetical protein NQ315_010937 [Exocentrus adspersus]|uniref:Uncharacterized protein n=1 Tax=Exocentrus adspersus TaxID=1586481 RepID=A0AAV8VPM5_9CUCU|nr:hypothetical protein NQ315_010937 [Exocentrus adspersus]
MTNSNNPRRPSTARRKSKSFRQFPQIIVHPAENQLSVTNSMPDIHSSLLKDLHVDRVFNNVSNLNASCPDLTGGDIFCTHFDAESEDDVFEDYDDYSENLSVCSETMSDFKYQQEQFVREPRTRKTNSYSVVESQNLYLKDLNSLSLTKQKYAGSLSRRKKKDEMPSDVLKRNWKMKHSTSMHNLFKETPRRRISEQPFDNYYTVHGENHFSHHGPVYRNVHSRSPNYAMYDYPPAW